MSSTSSKLLIAAAGATAGLLAGCALRSLRKRGADAARAVVTASGADSKRGRILVTGGTGYIGSHTVLQLLDAGFHVTIVDNLCNSR